MHSSNPKNRCVRQIQKPPMKIQITFMTRHRQPPELPLSVTRLPKGQRASIPNFNVCNPKGIPIIVIISSKLDIRYSTAVSNPPQISQMILPKIHSINIINYFYFHAVQFCQHRLFHDGKAVAQFRFDRQRRRSFHL